MTDRRLLYIAGAAFVLLGCLFALFAQWLVAVLYGVIGLLTIFVARRFR